MSAVARALPRGGSGQTLVIFAVVLAFLLIGMLSLIADLGAVFTAYTRADNVALLAAQAGASAIDENAYYGGQLQLNPGDALNRCQTVLHSSGLPLQPPGCSATPQEVTANVQFSAPLPLPLPGATAPIHVVRTARGVYGGTSARQTTT